MKKEKKFASIDPTVALAEFSQDLQIQEFNETFLKISQADSHSIQHSNFNQIYPSNSFVEIIKDVIKTRIPYFHFPKEESLENDLPVFLKNESWSVFFIQSQINQKETLLLAIFPENKKHLLQNLILLHTIEGICLARMEDGVIIQVDRKFEEMFGYSPGEMVGKDVSSLNSISEDTPEQTKKKIMNALRENGAWRGEVKNKKKDGSHFWCYANVFVYNHPDFGSILISVHSDITERKEQEEFLKFQGQIISNLAEGVCLATIKEEKIVFTNPAYEKMFGYCEKEMIGMDFSNLNAPAKKSPNETKQVIMNIIIETGEFHGEIFNIRKDGTPFWTYGNISVFNHPMYGEVLASVQTDITKQKQIEADNIRAQKIQSISLLAGGIAHDFNNILSAILGNVNLLQLNEQQDDSTKLMLQMIEKSVEKANSLTHQLLTFSKGGAPIKNTGNIVSVVDDSAKFILHGSKLKYILKTIGSIPPVDMDGGQINQVLNNLIINASESMENGGIIEIYIDVIQASEANHVFESKGKIVRIKIRDHGSGISIENQSQIFNPYFSTKSDGNGLGLATSYSIITNHNGFITFESEVGFGTQFIIYLPASENQIKTDKTLDQEISKLSGLILIIDDDYAIQNILQKMLAELGLETISAKNGYEGVEEYHKHFSTNKPISLVICDLTIPGDIGGKEAMRQILEINPSAIGIVSSGYSQDPIMSQFENYGFKGILNKPYTFNQLRSILGNLLNT